MPSVVEILAGERSVLVPLFEPNRYDRVLADSVLEGHCGAASADSVSHPSVARLDSGAFTVLAGDARSPATGALLRRRPVQYVSPENGDWRRALRGFFDNRISILRFTAFSPDTLDSAHLSSTLEHLPAGFDIRRVDAELAERLPAEMDHPYLLDSYRSAKDFLRRGVGFCALCGGRMVTVAVSMASSSRAIDVDIKTLADFRRRGLGTAVGAMLSLHCLERGIEPHWLAANRASERLALRLGYSRGETYETFETGGQDGLPAGDSD